ncbi:WD40-repeat-containing domain protein [Rhizoctonia solani]|nr:WD40-repeat-containing domain protein [Rhizoctonia solani]
MPRPKPAGTGRMPIIHEGHTANVHSVTFSPDGDSVASGSKDKTIHIWDAYSPFPIDAPLREHTGSVCSVSYSPLGEPLHGHKDSVNSVAFSPDGNLIASGSDDKTVCLWDVNKRTIASDPFVGHDDWVRSVAFFPDSVRIGSGSMDMKIRIWDVEHGRTVMGPLEGHSDVIFSVDVSPDGSQIISGSYDKTLLFWDTRSGAITGKPFKGHNDWVSAVSFSPSGIYVASSSGDKTVCVWDIRTGRQVDEPYEQHKDAVNSVAFSPNGRYIASASDDRTVMVWNISGTQAGSDAERDPTPTIGDDNKPLSIGRVNESLKADSVDMVGRYMPTANLIDGGGFGDIWRGELNNGTRVAIKTWRAAVIQTGDYKVLKRGVREIHYWSKMKHKNVHPLMGIIMFKGQSIAQTLIASSWLVILNITEYLAHLYVILSYSIQVATGIAYIHSHKMVHGDIKAFNVLISSDGVAKLTDFGISTMSDSSIGFSGTTTSQAGSVRWMAPELLVEEPSKTKESDIYALGMTILENFTGSVPYSECRGDHSISSKISQGIFPTRPMDQIKDDAHGNMIWDLLVGCWNMKPDARPSVERVAESLSSISAMGI